MIRATSGFTFAGSPAGEGVPAAPRAVAWWLLACCALVFAMVVVGGITRLTHSGLSIVEWQPILGALPPLDDAQWAETFAKYRKTPEFRLKNFDMTLAGFKEIFWWEYIHRNLGRVIGLAFFAPFMYFLLRRKLDKPLAWKLAGIFALGALQGFMGWYMVASGLVDDPRVSQFRLAAHLTLAFVIYAAMFWVALGILFPQRYWTPAGLRSHGSILVVLVFAMVVTGGLVAGIRAGYAYNTFPLMNGHVIPPEILMIEPWWKNFGYNMATVQFDHRVVAWLLIFLVPWLWWRTRRAAELDPRAYFAAHLLLAMLAIQVALGISTLLLRVPVVLGVLHQGVAVLVLTAALWMRHALR
ncbi:COX15/CtaA family protein [Usitatibacter palustris]|uniref:Heme A synthase n=1 Tax=Usitatibacter palustris TaxID=2732487 RepID=A0A6M4H6N1_9PROT|nr:COX15/CtaA family protein [Usitatibacter palustris]QJR14323.1 Heme A synthase [Usitatibacter palustris]